MPLRNRNRLELSGRRASSTAEYRAWGDMLSRCRNPKHRQYPRYGGRGIFVCDEWRDSFKAFFSHVGPRPDPPPGQKRMGLDRIENNRGYEPGNVRWATQSQQLCNTRRTVFVEVNGERMCVSELSERTGISPKTLRSRVLRGSRVALTKPVISASRSVSPL
jgi:DNA-directed RNA polymerase specialized sigma24 family protein